LGVRETKRTNFSEKMGGHKGRVYLGRERTTIGKRPKKRVDDASSGGKPKINCLTDDSEPMNRSTFGITHGCQHPKVQEKRPAWAGRFNCSRQGEPGETRGWQRGGKTVLKRGSATHTVSRKSEFWVDEHGGKTLESEYHGKSDVGRSKMCWREGDLKRNTLNVRGRAGVKRQLAQGTLRCRRTGSRNQQRQRQ